jgi:hypothetical protein
MKARKNQRLNSIFGVPYNPNMTLNPSWEKENIVSIELPFAMYLAWSLDTQVTHIRVHKLAAPYFKRAFAAVWAKARYLTKQEWGFDHTTEFYDEKTIEFLHSAHLDLFGGSFTFRAMRGSNQISNHSYGIAIDIDPGHHVMGNKQATFPDWYIGCWTGAGFNWGGKWSGKNRDSMHFEIVKLAA